MSLGRRLYNVARAELKDAARKIKDAASEPFAPNSTEGSEHGGLGQDADQPSDAPPPPPRYEQKETLAVNRFYANLELPIGSSADEVKAAYRRLMRRFHPDHFQADPERAAAANALTLELRTAYEGLLAHLEGK